MDIRPNDPRYVSLVVQEWARSLPEPQPLSQREREVLNEMLHRQDKGK